MKKTLPLLLILVMLIGMMPMEVFATVGTQETVAVEVVTEPAEAPEEKNTTPAEDTEEAEPSKLAESEEDAEAVHEHDYENGICAVCGSAKPVKTISILGDSISTYKDWSNGSAAKTTNSTISTGAIYYPRSSFDVTAESTWWYQVADKLGMEILVNNSWSGSCLLNTRFGTVGAYADRCVQLHDDTGENAGQKPDIIAIFLGTNDYYSYPNTLGNYETIDFDALIQEIDGSFHYAQPVTSLEAYAISLHKISLAYPDAQVYCFTLLPRVNSSNQPTSFNEDICQLADKFGVHTVDLYNCGIQSASTAFYKMMGDNLHPDNPGMDAITNAFVSELLKNSDLTTYDVFFELEGTIAMEGTSRRVVSGDSFETVLTPLDASLPLDITVTMGGLDITDSCWADSMVSIPSVTADVVITAKPGQREPLNFRWETQADLLVSVTSGGNTANSLTMTHGSITDGVFAKTRFTMSQGISLRHDLTWCVEWKSSGTWTDTTDGALLFAQANTSTTADTCYFYRRHKNDFFALGSYTGGKYHNYGVKLSGTGIDTTAEHVFRLENRIASDGSNMIWLIVDGENVGPLNHHYIGGTDQKETVDWVNGKDFTFSYMGTNPHTIGGCSLEYIQVWENYHTHVYESAVTAPTFTASGKQQKVCSVCGDTVTETLNMLVGEVSGWNVTICDDLQVNFHLNISQSIESTARVRIVVGEEGHTFRVSGLEKTEDGLYIASVNIAAAQMTDFIFVTVINGSDLAETASYTVRGYADTILADESFSEYHALVKEMLNYGAAAQLYFDYEEENLANEGVADAGSAEIPDSVDSELSVTGNAEGVTFYGASLIFRNKIAVRYYFQFKGDINDCSFTVNDTTYAPQLKDGLYYVEIADILPQDLDEEITLTVTDANGNALSATYGPTNYIVRMYEKGSADLQNLLKALYNYHLAAKTLQETA